MEWEGRMFERESKENGPRQMGKIPLRHMCQIGRRISLWNGNDECRYYISTLPDDRERKCCLTFVGPLTKKKNHRSSHGDENKKKLILHFLHRYRCTEWKKICVIFYCHRRRLLHATEVPRGNWTNSTLGQTHVHSARTCCGC